MIIRRIVVLISTIIVITCVVSLVIAEETTQYDTKAVETINRLSTYIGKPGLYREDDPDDLTVPINGRILVISKNNDKWNLKFSIRISRDVCCGWNLELTKLNLHSIIENTFDENAPLLYTVYTVNNDIVDYYIYRSDKKDSQPFSSFLAGFDRIIQNIEPTPLPVYMPGDIFLSDFHDLYWYSDIESVKEQLKQFTLDTKVFSDRSSACYFVKNIGGYDLQYSMGFTNNKLTNIGILFPDDTRPIYLDQIKEIYGEPIETAEYTIYLGLITKQSESDCFLWYTDYTDIVYPYQTSGYPTDSISYICRDNLPHWNPNIGE